MGGFEIELNLLFFHSPKTFNATDPILGRASQRDYETQGNRSELRAAHFDEFL